MTELQNVLARIRATAETEGRIAPSAEPACSACRDKGMTYNQTADGIVVAAPCRCLYAGQEDRNRAATMRGLGTLHQADAVARAAEIVPDAASRGGMRWARAWSPDHAGAVIWGRVGSGKSTLLCRLMRRLGPKSAEVPDAAGHSVCLVSIPSLLGEMAYRQHRGGYPELLALLGRVDVLAIDDLGVGRLHRGWPAQLWAVLDARWSAGRKPVLVTSNHDPATMVLEHQPEDASDVERAMDRLHALAPVSVCYDAPASRRQG